MSQFMLQDIWKPVIEIVILWFVIYRIMLFFAGTRAILVLRGIIVILLAFFIVQRLNFLILEWLFTKLFAISVLALLIIFQPEIRQGLANLGRRHLFEIIKEGEDFDLVLKEVLTAVENLSNSKIGALIVLAKEDPLSEYIKSGVIIDGRPSSELIQTIFTPNSLLHDGGVILQGGRVMAAGCIFPLTQKEQLHRFLGTRHRAAIGLSEETDAVVIVVSEERQDISLAYKGQLYQGLTREVLFSKIKEIFKTEGGRWLKRILPAG